MDSAFHKTAGTKKLKTVLFVCIENSCRSQMAEAFAKIIGLDVCEAYSCGSKPSGKVNEKAIVSMNALAYDMAMHCSKGFDALPSSQFDFAITMGCDEVCCPDINALQREDWAIPDPKAMPMSQFVEVRDLIRQKVSRLIETLRQQERGEN